MKMRKQRLMGVWLLAISWLVLLLACTGESPEDQDATAALLVLPLGLYMVYSDDYLLYDGEPVARARDRPEAALLSPPYEQLHRKESTAWQETGAPASPLSRRSTPR